MLSLCCPRLCSVCLWCYRRAAVELISRVPGESGCCRTPSSQNSSSGCRAAWPASQPQPLKLQALGFCAAETCWCHVPLTAAADMLVVLMWLFCVQHFPIKNKFHSCLEADNFIYQFIWTLFTLKAKPADFEVDSFIKESNGISQEMKRGRYSQ